MSRRSNSRYLLGHLSFKDISELKPGEETVLLLNPEEPDAIARVSASMKSAFFRAGKRCELASQRLLVDSGDGVWKQSAYLTVKVLSRHQEA